MYFFQHLSFVHLHAHSHYSLLTALGAPGAMSKKVAKDGGAALALTDFGNMHGALDFYSACKSEGIKSILGLEIFLAPRSRFDKEAADALTSNLVLLAKNNTGYENLLKIASEAALHGFFYRPRIDWDFLEKNSEGIICLSGAQNGEIAQSILRGDSASKTEKIALRAQKIFGEDFYLEIIRHPAVTRDFPEKKIRALSKKLNIPLVATNNAHYPETADSGAQDILLCIRDNAQRADPNRRKMLGDDFSLRSPSEMTALFSDLPEATENTLKIAEKCEVNFEFGKYLLPQFPVPEEDTVESFLEKRCREGLIKRYGENPDPKIEKRLEYEMGIINQMGFPAYFLIVGDFVKWAKDHDIPVGPGRGSAAGSLVSYCLSITNIDPIRYSLLFERFLNPERVSMPDIDIDFSDDRRDEVLNYVREKYGEDRVAQICTFGTMAARAAVKDVGRVLGLGFAEMNEFVKLIPERPGITLDEAFEESPDLKKALAENERFAEDWQIAKKLEGGVRHVSVHACAVVISPDPITKHSAIAHPPKDENAIITQFSAKPIDKLGLLKMDFLGLKNLTILAKTLEIIERRHRTKIILDEIPLDDKKSFVLLTKGQTTGVFQLESAGMRRYLKELKPTNLEDIIAMVSLYRPGPMEWIPDYIAGKHGKKTVKYPHKSLEPILKTTFGIAIYQEQILQIAQVFAGFSLGQADILRRAIGKKIASELAAQREKFIEGAQELGYQEALAIKIFDEVIEPFAGYGFNKSHAAGYAMIAYQTAYLKANYPTEFMTALLQSDRNNTDRVILDIEECREMKIEVLPPSVNESDANFTAVDSGNIRFGLGAIKGVGDSVVDEVVKNRGEDPYETLADFAARNPSKIINKKSLEALAKSGALAGLAEANEIIENTKAISDFCKSEEKSSADDAQDSLFGGEETGHRELVLPETSPASEAQRLAWERETLGIFVSDHPLRKAKKYFQRKGTLIADLKKKKGKKVKIGGLLMSLRKIITKTKKQMAILSIEDMTGKCEIAVFPNSYEAVADKLVDRSDVVFWVSGKAEDRSGEMQVIADTIELQEITEIETVVAKFMEEESDSEKISEERISAPVPSKIDENACPGDATHPFVLRLKEGLKKGDLLALKKILSAHPGKCPAEIHAFDQVFYLPHGVSGCKGLRSMISQFVQKQD